MSQIVYSDRMDGKVDEAVNTWEWGGWAAATGDRSQGESDSRQVWWAVKWPVASGGPGS